MSLPQAILVTGISEPDEQTFSIYPNPAQDRIFFRMPGKGVQGTVELLNIAGQRVFATDFLFDGKEQVVHLDFLAQGFYMVRVVCGESTFVSRIQVIR